jgi:hypothetical protein
MRPKRKGVRKNVRAAKSEGATGDAVQKALQLTWVLNGNLKRAQLMFIRIGTMLAQVRDQKMYVDLKHPDIEDYALQRLRLGRSSLFRYLQIHDWLAAFHKEWLVPSPKGYVPDMAAAGNLMWIEYTLAGKTLTAARRARLEALHKLALDGRLKKADLDAFRRDSHGPGDGLKAFLTNLQRLRSRGAELATLPPEVMPHLDAAIDLLCNARTLDLAGIQLMTKCPAKGKWAMVIRRS